MTNPLIRDSFWAVFGNVLGKGLSFAAGIAVARFLGKVSFGEYGLITSTLLSASILSTFGLGYTATKYISEYKIKRKELIRGVIYHSKRITLISSGVLALVLFVFSEFLANKILNSSHLQFELKIVSVWIIFNALTTTQIGVLAGFGLFKEMTKINAIVGVFTFISSLSLAFFWGLKGALLAMLLNQLLNWYLNNRLVEKEQKNYFFEVSGDKQLFKEIFKFSVPIAFQEALYSVSSWFISWSFVKYSNVGELGLYQASIQVSSLILFVPGILRNVFLAHLSQTNEDEGQNKNILRTTLWINSVSVLLPIIVVLIFLGPIVQLYGVQFEGIKNLIVISSVTTFFTSVTNVYNQALLSKGKNWIIFWTRLIRDFVLIFAFVQWMHNNYSSSRFLIELNLIFGVIFMFVLMIFYYRITLKLSS
jgi:O-antigen/teichoic acid export membrane protein